MPGRTRTPARRKRGRTRRQRPQQTRRPFVLKVFALVCIGLVLGVLPVFVSNAIGYVPILAYVLMLVCMRVYLACVCRGLSFGCLASAGSCPRNTDLQFLMRFRNKAPLPCTKLRVRFCVTDIFGEVDAMHDFNLSLDARRTRDVRFGVRFAHIGTCQVGIASVRVEDLLGLFGKTIPGSGLLDIEVTPRIYPVSSQIVESLELNETQVSRTPFQQDGMDYRDVREYRPGDPMKAVHWKLSSRTDELYTKLYETSGTPGLAVLMDMRFPQDGRSDLMSLRDTMLEAALSIHRFGRDRGLYTELLFRDKEGQLALYKDAEDIDYHELLGRLPSPAEQQLGAETAQLIAERSQSSLTPGNLVLVTAQPDTELIVALDEARARGKRPMAFIATCPDDTREYQRFIAGLRRRMQDANIPATVLDALGEVEELRFD